MGGHRTTSADRPHSRAVPVDEVLAPMGYKAFCEMIKDSWRDHWENSSTEGGQHLTQALGCTEPTTKDLDLSAPAMLRHIFLLYERNNRCISAVLTEFGDEMRLSRLEWEKREQEDWEGEREAHRVFVRYTEAKLKTCFNILQNTREEWEEEREAYRTSLRDIEKKYDELLRMMHISETRLDKIEAAV